jgi:tetratricopeptide (TPR) repeat protein
MSRIGKLVFTGLLGTAVAAGVGISTSTARAQAQAQQQYSTEEYNVCYTKPQAETDPQGKIKLLDECSSKYPNSTLNPYVFNMYVQTYAALKDYPNEIKYIDKLGALPNLDANSQVQARVQRAQAFLQCANLPECSTPQALSAERDSAQQGMNDLTKIQKPDKVSDDQFAQIKKQITGILSQAIATAAYAAKDWAGAATAYKNLVALDPTDGPSWVRYGTSLLQQNPPQTLDGMWVLAHALSVLKPPADAQVKTYLKGQIARYQQVGCDNLVDEEMTQMVTMAATTPDRPSTYALSTTDDLTKARNDTANFIPALRAGGDQGKTMWLATCGLEFPEVVAKVISVDAASDTAIVLHLCTGASPEETEACKAPNMEVKIADQPDAKRVQPEDDLRFDATLAGYDPNPFMLHWEKGKVNPEDIPAPNEKGKKKPIKHGTR